MFCAYCPPQWVEFSIEYQVGCIAHHWHLTLLTVELFWLGDMDIVDVRMPQVLELALNLLAFCGLTIIGIIIATPWFAIVMVPIIAGFLYVIRYFRRSVRELQRLEGITRSPLVSNVQATVQGLTTIRAYNKVDTFRAVNK